MIDKSIPYLNIIMRYDGPTITEKPSAPNGFRFRDYQDGDELAWARMEVDNNDFDTYENAVNYFNKKYCAFPDKLRERFVGIENSEGKMCGIVICWDDVKDDVTVASVHWLVTDPKEQGKGLGVALVKMLLYKFSILKMLPIYLHTQPWSYVAIGIYSKVGFKMLTTDSFRNYENQSLQALGVLKEFMKDGQFEKLKEEMIGD